MTSRWKGLVKTKNFFFGILKKIQYSLSDKHLKMGKKQRKIGYF
jgi:hypothetical protein